MTYCTRSSIAQKLITLSLVLEAGISRNISKIVRPYKEVYYWKVNDNFQAGVPDIFIETPTSDFWIEVKYIKKLPVRHTTPIDLTNTSRFLSLKQQMWIKRRNLHRQDAFVLLASPIGCNIFPNNEWEIPFSVKEFRDRALNLRDTIIELLQLT